MSPYIYAEKFGKAFGHLMGIKNDLSENSSHADKADQYDGIFERHDIDLNDGTLIYLLSFEPPFSSQVRDTANGWVSVESWLENMCTDESVISSLSLMKSYENNISLIEFHKVYMKCLENGDFTELNVYKESLPKLCSENFYNLGVYNCSERGSSYDINIKNNGNYTNGFCVYFKNNFKEVGITSTKTNPFIPVRELKLRMIKEMFGGYIICPETDGFEISELLSYELGIGTGFVEPYVEVYSKIEIATLAYPKNYLLLTVNKETKEVKVIDLIEHLKLFLNSVSSTELKLQLIKELVKD